MRSLEESKGGVCPSGEYQGNTVLVYMWEEAHWQTQGVSNTEYTQSPKNWLRKQAPGKLQGPHTSGQLWAGRVGSLRCSSLGHRYGLLGRWVAQRTPVLQSQSRVQGPGSMSSLFLPRKAGHRPTGEWEGEALR